MIDLIADFINPAIHELLGDKTFYEFVVEQMKNNEFFSAAALSGLGVGIWQFIKGPLLNAYSWVRSRIRRKLFYSVTIEQTDPAFKYIDEWVSSNLPNTFRYVELNSKSKYNESSTNKVYTTFEPEYAYENDTVYLWKHFRRITFSKYKERLDSALDVQNRYTRKYTISGFLARRAITKLINTMMADINVAQKEKAEQKTKVKLYTVGSWDWECKGSLTNKDFKQLFFEGKDILEHDLEKFSNSRVLYNKLKVPFKRGYGFYGPPGNGKSSVAYAIADRLKMDLYVVDLKEAGANFVKYFGNIPSNSVVLIEDIDSFYKGRTCINDNKVNFSTLINALNGVANQENIITVFTTNHIETLDPALIRDGRCDFKMELRNPSKEVAEQYLEYVYEKPIKLDSMRELNFAELQNIVLKNYTDLETIKNKIQ